MSIDNIVKIRCDGSVDIGLPKSVRCPMTMYVENVGISNAIRYVEHCGWRMEEGRDYCPECTKERGLR